MKINNFNIHPFFLVGTLLNSFNLVTRHLSLIGNSIPKYISGFSAGLGVGLILVGAVSSIPSVNENVKRIKSQLFNKIIKR